MEEDIKNLSPLALAFLGDAVFSLYIREAVLKSGKKKSGELHEEAVKYERATAQAKLYKKIYDDLTKEEQDIIRRGRNSHPKTLAKSATPVDYHLATGVEALAGYLYLTENKERLSWLMEEAVKLNEE